MKKFFYNDNIGLLAVLFVFAIIISSIRVAMYHNDRTREHHELFNVVRLHDCYQGRFDICKIDIIKEGSSDVRTVEVEFMVADDQTLYQRCWYQGHHEDATRYCSTVPSKRLSLTYRTHYKDL